MNDDVAAALFAVSGADGVSGERRESGTTAGQDAEQEAEHRATPDRARGLPQVGP
jgi:hypothetical protein